MLKPYAFEILAILVEPLICSDRKRLTRWTTHEHTFKWCFYSKFVVKNLKKFRPA